MGFEPGSQDREPDAVTTRLNRSGTPRTTHPLLTAIYWDPNLKADAIAASVVAQGVFVSQSDQRLFQIEFVTVNEDDSDETCFLNFKSEGWTRGQKTHPRCQDNVINGSFDDNFNNRKCRNSPVISMLLNHTNATLRAV